MITILTILGLFVLALLVITIITTCWWIILPIGLDIILITIIVKIFKRKKNKD